MKNNEKTLLDSQLEAGKNPASGKSQAATVAAATIAGTVVGAASVMAGNAVGHSAEVATEEQQQLPTEEASDNTQEEVPVEAEPELAGNTAEPVAAEPVDPSNSPEPEEAIVAMATGVRVAHVDDDASFSQAFADARAQVGPGGVFEWHGRVYGTYYKDEWDNMTVEEKQEYQESIRYADVLPEHETTNHHHGHNGHHNVHPEPEPEPTPEPEPNPNPDPEPGQDVQVIEIGKIDVDGDGTEEDVAVIEVDGNRIYLVDMDMDGMADYALNDSNGDGELSNDEVLDIHGGGVVMPTETSYLAEGPDYMNDANVDLYA